MEEQPDFEIGRGWISGYASAALGLLSLCGVLCFRFPHLLTSEQFRSAYSADFARRLLFASLVASYFMGILSYGLNRSKRPAWIGIGSALFASLLGGSRIEVRPFASTPYSFGLDWFVLSLLFSMLIFIPLEKAFALNKSQKVLRPGWRTDLAYFFVSHLLIQFVFLFANSAVGAGFDWAVNAGLQGAVRSLPVIAQFLLATFLADVFQSAVHRLHHKVGFLWRFHSIHHSSEAMDWLAGSRTHIAEVVGVRAAVMVPLYVCGFSPAALNAYVVLVGVQSVAIHANMGLDYGPLRFLLVTPQYHHWHHAKDSDYVDANYAVHLPAVDMLFGTFKCPRGLWPKAYGVVDGAPPESFWGQMLHPFRRDD
jgi:lathosterol oxidase